MHSGLIPSQEELQACRSNAHFGHCATGSMTFCSSVPHFRTAREAAVPGMLIDSGPNVFSLSSNRRLLELLFRSTTGILLSALRKSHLTRVRRNIALRFQRQSEMCIKPQPRCTSSHNSTVSQT